VKNLEKIQKQKATRAANTAIKRKMDISSYELKIDSSHLSRQAKEKIELVFLSAKWLRNYMIGSNTIFSTPDSIKEVTVMVYNPETKKCDKPEMRNLAMSSQIKQSYIDSVQQSVKDLSAAKKKGVSIGRLKFSKEISAVPLNQPNVTYQLVGHNKIRLQGIGVVKVHGLEQIRGKILANAQLIKKASGFFIKVICYKEKEIRDKEGAVGIDMGIKDTLVFSDRRKIKVRIETPKRIKKLQKGLARKREVAKKQKREFASKNYIKEKIALQKAFERLSHQKDDMANKIVNGLKGYALVAIQDENLSGWQHGLFGKQVQESILGRIKTRIKRLETAKVINRFLPTTKFGPVSLKNLIVKLSDRVFKDGWYEEDRDIKAAKMILAFALYNPDLKPEEFRRLPVEELAAMIEKFYDLKQVADFSSQAESVETGSHSGFFRKVGNNFLLEATAL